MFASFVTIGEVKLEESDVPRRTLKLRAGSWSDVSRCPDDVKHPAEVISTHVCYEVARLVVGFPPTLRVFGVVVALAPISIAGRTRKQQIRGVVFATRRVAYRLVLDLHVCVVQQTIGAEIVVEVA